MLKSCCKGTKFYLYYILNIEKCVFNLSDNFFDLSKRLKNVQKHPIPSVFYRRKGLKIDKMAIFTDYNVSEGFSLLLNVNSGGGSGLL